MLPMQPNHLPAQLRAIISPEQQLVSVFCASTTVCVCVRARACVCVCVCVRESTGTKKL